MDDLDNNIGKTILNYEIDAKLDYPCGRVHLSPFPTTNFIYRKG